MRANHCTWTRDLLAPGAKKVRVTPRLIHPHKPSIILYGIWPGVNFVRWSRFIGSYSVWSNSFKINLLCTRNCSPLIYPLIYIWHYSRLHCRASFSHILLEWIWEWHGLMDPPGFSHLKKPNIRHVVCCKKGSRRGWEEVAPTIIIIQPFADMSKSHEARIHLPYSLMYTLQRAQIFSFLVATPSRKAVHCFYGRLKAMNIN